MNSILCILRQCHLTLFGKLVQTHHPILPQSLRTLSEHPKLKLECCRVEVLDVTASNTWAAFWTCSGLELSQVPSICWSIWRWVFRKGCSMAQHAAKGDDSNSDPIKLTGLRPFRFNFLKPAPWGADSAVRWKLHLFWCEFVDVTLTLHWCYTDVTGCTISHYSYFSRCYCTFVCLVSLVSLITFVLSSRQSMGSLVLLSKKAGRMF